MKLLLSILFCSLFFINTSFAKSGKSDAFADSILLNNISVPALPDTSNSDAENIKKLKELRASIHEMLVDIDQRILKTDSAINVASESEKSLSGRLFRGITMNFTERKLIWMQDIRDFLYNEQERLDGVIKGVSKASFAITRAKLKAIEKVKKLF